MGKQFSRLLAGLALSVLATACARMPNKANPNPLPTPSPQTGNVSPGPTNRGGMTDQPGAAPLGATPLRAVPRAAGIGAPAAPGATGAGTGQVRAITSGQMDLSTRISHYVAGLDAINGGSNAGGGVRTGGGGGGQIGAGRDMAADMAGAGTSRIGRGVGVSTVMAGNMAFIGIDPTTIGVGSMGGGRSPLGASFSGDARGAAGAGLEGYLRDRIRSRFPQVTEVYVTTEPALVSRIARASTATGTSQVAELAAIMHALAPSTGRFR